MKSDQPRIYLRRGKLVENVDDRYVDTALMHLIRYHGRTEQDQADLLAFCSNSVQTSQIAILVRHLGHHRPLLAASLTVDKVTIVPRQILAANMTLKDVGINWQSDGFILRGKAIPLSLTSQIEGGPLSKLIEHPYLPGDAIITKFTNLGDNIASVDLAPAPNRKRI